MRRAPWPLLLISIGIEAGCSKRSSPPVDPAPSASSRAAARPGSRAEGAAEFDSPPSGYSKMMVDGVTPTEEGSAVVLADPRKKLGLLIFVGGTEALSLALRLSKKQYERPLTHDLLDSVLTRFEARVTSVRVDKLENDIFHGTIVLHANGRRLQIDARPSDALALAVGNEAPVFVADEVIEAAGIDLRTLNPEKLDPEISEGSRDSRGDVEL